MDHHTYGNMDEACRHRERKQMMVIIDAKNADLDDAQHPGRTHAR